MPAPELDDDERAKTDPRSPNERVAAVLRSRIVSGELPVGALLPSGKQLGADFGVATATAQRAVALLQSWGLVRVSRGRRPIVLAAPDEATDREPA
jgi:DNA-binding GntR family transcriptional regulator